MRGAGRKRHLVFVQEVTETQDEFNQPVESWTTFKKARAAMKPLSGTERYQANQELAQATHEVTVYTIPGLTEKMRLLVPAREITFLDGAIGSGDATLTVQDSQAFPPSKEFRIRVGDELMLVSNANRLTTWNVTRGIDGTTPAPHTDGAAVVLMIPMDIESAQPIREAGREQLIVGRTGERASAL